MPLIYCKINLILTCSANSVISNAAANQAATFEITDTKFYFPVVSLSTNDNGKLLLQLKSGFKCTINWNEYQSTGVNRLFVLTFDVNESRIGHSRYFLPTSKLEDYNVIIDGKKNFDQPLKNNTKTYEDI